MVASELFTQTCDGEQGSTPKNCFHTHVLSHHSSRSSGSIHRSQINLYQENQIIRGHIFYPSYYRGKSTTNLELNDIFTQVTDYFDNLKKEILNWSKELPIYYNTTFENMKYNIINKLIGDIYNLGVYTNPEEYNYRLECEIEKCINSLPIISGRQYGYKTNLINRINSLRNNLLNYTSNNFKVLELNAKDNIMHVKNFKDQSTSIASYFDDTKRTNKNKYTDRTKAQNTYIDKLSSKNNFNIPMMDDSKLVNDSFNNIQKFKLDSSFQYQNFKNNLEEIVSFHLKNAAVYNDNICKNIMEMYNYKLIFAYPENQKKEIIEILNRSTDLPDAVISNIAEIIAYHIKMYTDCELTNIGVDHVKKPTLSTKKLVYRSESTRKSDVSNKESQIIQFNENVLKNYMTCEIKSWLSTIPNDYLLTGSAYYKDPPINILVNDIIEYYKICCCSNEFNMFKEDCIQFFVMKWLNQIQYFKNIDDAIPYVNALVERLNTENSNIIQNQTSNMDSLHTPIVANTIDSLETEIVSWLNDKESYIQNKLSQNKRNQMIHKLSQNVHDHIIKKNLEIIISKEITKWLSKIIKPEFTDTIPVLSDELRNRLYFYLVNKGLNSITEQTHNSDDSDKSALDVNENTLKNLIKKYIEALSEEDNLLVKDIYVNLFKNKIKLLNIDKHHSKQQEMLLSEKLKNELQYIEIVSDWLQTIPTSNLFSMLSDESQSEIVINIAEILNTNKNEEIQNSTKSNSNIYERKVLDELSIMPGDKQKLEKSVNQLFNIRAPITIGTPSQQYPSHNILGSDYNDQNQNQREIIEEYINTRGEEIIKDELKLSSLTKRILKEMDNNNTNVYPIVQLLENEFEYVKEICNWLNNLPLLSVSDKDAYDKTVKVVLDFINKIFKKNENNDVDTYVEDFILALPLNPNEKIDLRLAKQQLKKRLERIDLRMYRTEEPVAHAEKDYQLLNEPKSSIEKYKMRLNSIIKLSMQDNVRNNFDENNVLLKKLKDCLIAMFLLEHFDLNDKNVKSKYEKCLVDEINKYLHHAPTSFMVPPLNDPNDDLYRQLKNIPVPIETVISAEVKKIKTKCILDKWLDTVPLQKVTGLKELLDRDKLLTELARVIIEMENKYPNYDFNIDDVIIKFLQKLPLLSDQDLNIKIYSTDFKNILKRTLDERNNQIQTPKTTPKENDETKENTFEGRYIIANQYLPNNSASSMPACCINTTLSPKTPAELILYIVQNWCKQLPLPENTPQEKENAKMIKNDLVVKVVMKISELNINPETFNDENLYVELLDDELNKLLSTLPTCFELIHSKETRINELINAIKYINKLIKDEKERCQYKQDLKNTFDNIFKEVHTDPVERSPLYITLRDEIVDNFIKHSYYEDFNDKNIYKSVIRDNISKYLDNVKENNKNKNYTYSIQKPDNENSFYSDKILEELSKIRPPKKSLLKDDVQEIRLKSELTRLFDNFPENKLLLKNQIKSTLAKHLHEIMKQGYSLENQTAIRNEIIKCLKKYNENTDTRNIDAFIQKLWNTETKKNKQDSIANYPDSFTFDSGEDESNFSTPHQNKPRFSLPPTTSFAKPRNKTDITINENRSDKQNIHNFSTQPTPNELIYKDFEKGINLKSTLIETPHVNQQQNEVPHSSEEFVSLIPDNTNVFNNRPIPDENAQGKQSLTLQPATPLSEPKNKTNIGINERRNDGRNSHNFTTQSSPNGLNYKDFENEINFRSSMIESPVNQQQNEVPHSREGFGFNNLQNTYDNKNLSQKYKTKHSTGFVPDKTDFFDSTPPRVQNTRNEHWYTLPPVTSFAEPRNNIDIGTKEHRNDEQKTKNFSAQSSPNGLNYKDFEKGINLKSSLIETPHDSRQQNEVPHSSEEFVSLIPTKTNVFDSRRTPDQNARNKQWVNMPPTTSFSNIPSNSFKTEPSGQPTLESDYSSNRTFKSKVSHRRPSIALISNKTKSMESNNQENHVGKYDRNKMTLYKDDNAEAHQNAQHKQWYTLPPVTSFAEPRNNIDIETNEHRSNQQKTQKFSAQSSPNGSNYKDFEKGLYLKSTLIETPHVNQQQNEVPHSSEEFVSLIPTKTNVFDSRSTPDQNARNKQWVKIPPTTSFSNIPSNSFKTEPSGQPTLQSDYSSNRTYKSRVSHRRPSIALISNKSKSFELNNQENKQNRVREYDRNKMPLYKDDNAETRKNTQHKQWYTLPPVTSFAEPRINIDIGTNEHRSDEQKTQKFSAQSSPNGLDYKDFEKGINLKSSLIETPHDSQQQNEVPHSSEEFVSLIPTKTNVFDSRRTPDQNARNKQWVNMPPTTSFSNIPSNSFKTEPSGQPTLESDYSSNRTYKSRVPHRRPSITLISSKTKFFESNNQENKQNRVREYDRNNMPLYKDDNAETRQNAQHKQWYTLPPVVSFTEPRKNIDIGTKEHRSDEQNTQNFSAQSSSNGLNYKDFEEGKNLKSSLIGTSHMNMQENEVPHSSEEFVSLTPGNTNVFNSRPPPDQNAQNERWLTLPSEALSGKIPSSSIMIDASGQTSLQNDFSSNTNFKSRKSHPRPSLNLIPNKIKSLEPNSQTNKHICAQKYDGNNMPLKEDDKVGPRCTCPSKAQKKIHKKCDFVRKHYQTCKCCRPCCGAQPICPGFRYY